MEHKSETPLEKRNRLYAIAGSLSSLSIALIVLGCSLPCCVILIGALLTNNP
jgi:hypothetical protein